MKAILAFLLFAVSAAYGIEPRKPRPVTLRKDAIIDVFINEKVTTVLQFPETVTMVVGAGLTNGTTEGLVQFEHPPNSKSVVLRGLVKEGRVLVQAMTRGEVFAFRLIPDEEPDSIVRLTALAPEVLAAAGERASLAVEQDRIDQVIASACAAFEGKGSEGLEMHKVHNLWRGEEFETLLEMAARASADDVMVFKGLIRNLGTDDLDVTKLTPTLLVAKAREVQVARFDTIEKVVKPGEYSHFVMTVVGDGNGARGNISIKNRFDVALAR